MQFLFPGFLWALAALAIPIIIHLFHFRKFKKVEFTNVRLLKEIKEETSSRNKLKDLLILLSRLLALAFLVFAFAQPFIPKGDSVKLGSNAVSIFVDNSYSMNAVNGQTPILDIAKQKAREIINAYENSDQFQVLTHDFEGRHQRLVPKEDVLSSIDEIEITPRVRKLDQILNRQLQILHQQDDNKISYILSDFQSTIMSTPEAIDSSVEINIVPIQAVQENNISIDSVWLAAGIAFQSQSNSLLVSITNHSDESVENVRLSIVKDGQEKPEGQLNISNRNTIIDTINLSVLETGWHIAEIKISDYPVQFDDSYWITFYVDENLELLNIREGGANRYLTALFNGLDNFSLTNVNATSINYGELERYKLLILHDIRTLSSGMNAAFKTYLDNGGKILLFPSESMDVNSYNAFLNSVGANTFQNYVKKEQAVSRINTEEFIFNGVFANRRRNLTLPSVSASYTKSRYQNRPEEILLTFRNGTPFLSKTTRGKGMLYVCSSPLDEGVNNLVLNAEIFVPMIFKMAIAKSTFEPLSYTIGGNIPIEVKKAPDNTDLVYRMEGKTEFIPAQINLGQKVLLQENGQVKDAGIYTLKNNNTVEKQIAFNYDRRESDLKVSNLENLPDSWNILSNTLTADFTTIVNEKDKGVTFWKWCLILALIFLALETLLLRFWKK